MDLDILRAKVAQVPPLLEELDIDLWMTFVRESASLHDPSLDLVVGGNVTWRSAFCLGRRGERIALVGSLDAAAHEALGVYPEIVKYVQGIGQPLRDLLARLDPRSIAVNYSSDEELADGLTHGMFLDLVATIEGTPYRDRLVSSEGIVASLRSRKSPPELERITRACEETVDLFARLSRRLRPGLTEREIAGEMVSIMRQKGLEPAWDPDHCPAVFAGPESAGAHAGPTDRCVEPGHLVNVDFGMKVEGYCSDLQRSWYFLRPGEAVPPSAVERAFGAVRKAILDAAAFMRPGVLGREVDAVARDVIVGAGFDEYPHALGHQIGRLAHDGGGLLAPAWERYGRRPFVPVAEGQTYTLEPRAFVPGHGTATIEEIVVVTPDGCRFLSSPQRELWLVPIEPPGAALV